MVVVVVVVVLVVLVVLVVVVVGAAAAAVVVGGVTLIQTKQKRAEGEQRNKYKPRTETRTTPSNQTRRRAGGFTVMYVYNVCNACNAGRHACMHGCMYVCMDVRRSVCM